MLVVADSSPLNILIRIGLVEVLPALFGRVLMPPFVHQELTDQRSPEVVRQFMEVLPDWLHIAAPVEEVLIPPLDRGEEQAINLALNIHADAMLIDERPGRREAEARGFIVIGTVGILELAANKKLVVLKDAFERLLRTDFRISPHLLRLALERDAARQALE